MTNHIQPNGFYYFAANEFYRLYFSFTKDVFTVIIIYVFIIYGFLSQPFTPTPLTPNSTIYVQERE